MRNLIEEKVFKDIAQKSIHYLVPVRYEGAEGLVARVYEQMIRDFQLVPPLTVHSPVPKLLAGSWAITRETLVAGSVCRTDREAVAATTSTINGCPFCVDVHTIMLSGGSKPDVVDAILTGKADLILEPQTRSIVEWTLATRSPGSTILADPPFSPKEAPEIIGTAVSFHYFNRMVNVFMYDGSPLRLPTMFKWLKGPIRRVAGSVIAKRMIGLSVRPGESLPLLPEADLPDEFSWAKPNPAVAGAFARFVVVTEEAGREVLPEPVRALVHSHVDAWKGEDPGMSRCWVEEATRDLEGSQKVAARLALLTALASYQVDGDVINAFRTYYPSDVQLVSTTAWASSLAMRRISSWLHSDG